MSGIPPIILVVGESNGIRKLVEMCCDGLKEFEVLALASLSNLDTFIERMPGRQIPVIVMDYGSVTEGIGGGSTTTGTRDRLNKAKILGMPEGSAPRLLIGIASLHPFQTQLKGFGCDVCVAENNLVSTLQQKLRTSAT